MAQSAAVANAHFFPPCTLVFHYECLRYEQQATNADSCASFFSFGSNRAASILIIALGTMYYTWVKSQEGAQAARPAVPPRDPVDVEKGEPETETVELQAQGASTASKA